jgi:Amt family ammonium transporter
LNQLRVQLTGIEATIGLAVLGTLLICIIVEKTVKFRLTENEEIGGLDYSLHGEHGYGLIGS